MDHKKNTIVLDHTKSLSYQRRKQGVRSLHVSPSTTSTDRRAKATATARIARVEAALRDIRRSEASSAGRGDEKAEKESGEDWDGEKHEGGDEKSVDSVKARS